MTPLRFLAACALLCASSAYAQAQSCMKLADLLKEISGPKYNEVPAFTGTVTQQGRPIAIMGFANPETGTFTILLRPAPDIACPIMDGSGWQTIEKDNPPTQGQAS